MMEKISACLIVKDEEQNVSRFVSQLEKFCDEIVVVDTGSSDKTAKAVKDLKCELYYFKWCDDFSAARNYSIEVASNDWIYWHDADDDLTDENIEKIRQLDFDKYDAFFFETRSLGEQKKIKWANSRIRLFNKNTGLRFFKPVHETIEFIDGLRYLNTDVFVNHLGYVDVSKVMIKNRRNLKILKKWKGDSPEWNYFVANEYMLVGEYENAEKYFKKFLEEADEGRMPDLCVNACLKLAVYYKANSKRDDAIWHLGKAVALNDLRPEAYIFLGDIEENKETAIIIYNKALDRAKLPDFIPATIDFAFYTYLPHMRLGDAYYKMEKYQKAIEHYEKALVYNSEFEECLVNLKDCHRKMADFYNKKVIDVIIKRDKG